MFVPLTEPELDQTRELNRSAESGAVVHSSM